MTKPKPPTIKSIEREFDEGFLCPENTHNAVDRVTGNTVRYWSYENPEPSPSEIKQFYRQKITEMLEWLEMETAITARRFWLVRDEDVSEISGTGVVADGVVFPDGVAVLRWRTAGGSTAVYDSVDSIEEIHGHDGKTKVIYVNELAEKTKQLKEQ